MTSDEERREVAQKLRERTKKPMGKSMQCMFTETLDIYAHNICWRNPDKATNRWDVIVNYLADLIDRPTCRIGYVPGSADRSCSACGVTFSTGTYQGGDHEEHEFMFCPNCGAEVKDDAESNLKEN